MAKNYEIGQVVYVVPEQAQTILPGIIVEELIVRKITGNSTSWKIKIGSPEKAKIIDSEKVNGEVYGSLEEVRLVISNKLSDYLNKVTSDAEGLVEKWYGKDIAEKQKNLSNTSASSLGSDPSDPDLLLSSLEGRSSFVTEQSASSASNVTMSQSRRPESPDDVREKLRRMSQDDSVFDTDPDSPKVYITQPDGSKIEVVMPKI